MELFWEKLFFICLSFTSMHLSFFFFSVFFSLSLKWIQWDYLSKFEPLDCIEWGVFALTFGVLKARSRLGWASLVCQPANLSGAQSEMGEWVDRIPAGSVPRSTSKHHT